MPDLLAALQSLSTVRRAGVSVHTTRSGTPLLVAVVDLTPGRLPDLVAVRRDVAELVSEDQLPARLVTEVEVTGGLVLGSPRPAVAQAFRAPQGRTERQVAYIWAGVLGWEEIGADDDLDELGADSLTTVEAIVQITEVLRPGKVDGEAFELAALDARTVADYANVIERGV